MLYHAQEHQTARLGPITKPGADAGRRNQHLNGEPCLDDLLNDPIMALLWQRDHLAPPMARATVRALQALVQRRYQDRSR